MLLTFETILMGWYRSLDQFIREFFLNTLNIHNLGTILIYTIFMIVVFGFVRGFMGLWRQGDFWSFLRQDFNELYRDDLASIGGAAYMAIINTADQLSLKSVDPPPGAMPPPNFGAPKESTRVRRI